MKLSIFTTSHMSDYKKKISISVYLILAITFITIGSYTLFENPFVCRPIHSIYTDNYILDSLAVTQGILHLFIDLSATYLLIGLRLLWSAMNYEKSNYFDYLVFIFFFISLITHWVESFNEERDVNNPIYSLIPMLLIGFVILIKRINIQD